jgi:hypothetical protein
MHRATSVSAITCLAIVWPFGYARCRAWSNRVYLRGWNPTSMLAYFAERNGVAAAPCASSGPGRCARAAFEPWSASGDSLHPALIPQT